MKSTTASLCPVILRIGLSTHRQLVGAFMAGYRLVMEDGVEESGDRLRMELSPLRGVWPGFEADLQKLGFSALTDLRGCDPVSLAKDYCHLTDCPIDAVIRVSFEAAVRFAETGTPVPWWRLLRAELTEDRARLVLSVRQR